MGKRLDNGNRYAVVHKMLAKKADVQFVPRGKAGWNRGPRANQKTKPPFSVPAMKRVDIGRSRVAVFAFHKVSKKPIVESNLFYENNRVECCGTHHYGIPFR